MQAKEESGSIVWLVAGIAALCAALIWGGVQWPPAQSAAGATPGFPFLGTQGTAPSQGPLVELLKLVAAALIGMMVTAVHKRCRRKKKPLNLSLAQAQILLCVSGALVMIIISDNFARAFGVAGAASIIRFRTPVKDPKDTTILFLLIALGMAAGLGLFAVAGAGTAFLCLFLYVLDQLSLKDQKPRAMMVELVAKGSEFPTAHVESVFARYRMLFEPREVTQGQEATVRYRVTLDPNTSLDALSEQLMNGGASGIKSVAWGSPKKRG